MEAMPNPNTLVYLTLIDYPNEIDPVENIHDPPNEKDHVESIADPPEQEIYLREKVRKRER
eukprot:1457644-Pyramimonas_sp.AAC.1